MTREVSGRRWSIYLLLLLALLAALVIFSSSWLATTAKELAEKQGDQAEVEAPAKTEPSDASRSVVEGDDGEESPPQPDPSPQPEAESIPAPDAPPQPAAALEGTWSPAEHDRTAHKRLVEAMRAYLDLDENIWTTRNAVEVLLGQSVRSDAHPLANMQTLRWLVAQSRSFAPSLLDRSAAQRTKRTVTALGEWGHEIKDEKSRFHLRVPSDAHGFNPDRYPRAGPWPTVFVLPDGHDVESKGGAGKAWLSRTWPRQAFPDVYRTWFVLMPLAAKGRYSKGGTIDPVAVHGTFRAFWKSHHMDFDRVVVDGRDDALLAAVTNSRSFFAGVILRGLDIQDGKIRNAKIRDSLSNLGSLPVYVVDQPDVVRVLREAGVQSVVAGGGGAELLQWMTPRRRTTPRSFHWRMIGRDQALANWINIDRPTPNAAKRELTVAVRDNVIDIQATGIEELTLFLDDDLVDLDDVVRVRVNDKLVIEDLIPMRAKTRETTRRDLRAIFEHPVIDVRKHRYYGWLKAAQLTRIKVP